MKRQSGLEFIPHPENPVCKNRDEWFSGGIPLHRNPERRETTAVKPWSFIKKGGSRMRKANVLLAVLFFVFSVNLSYAQYGKKSSQQTEVKKSGGANIVTPKGAKLIKKDGATFVENLRDYTSRKFTEVESRLKTLETDNASLKKSLEDLNKTVSSLQKQLAVLTQRVSNKEQIGQTPAQSKESANEPAEQPGATSQQ